MRRTFLTASFALLAAGPLCAQTAPQFEVATIKPAPPQPPGQTNTRMSTDTDKGQLAYSNVNLKEMIARAYKILQLQIIGPDWLETERFDVVARFPRHSRSEDLPLMLQALLGDRFRLAIHRETKEMPVYALTVTGDGPKFKAIEESTGTTSNTNRTGHHVVAKLSLAGLAEFLTNEVGRPVLDKTGLAGAYEMKLDWALDGASTGDGVATLPSLFTALPEQLGLKLQSTKGPVETVVVDHVERTPTEN